MAAQTNIPESAVSQSPDDSSLFGSRAQTQPSADEAVNWKLRGNPVSDQSTAVDKLGFRPYVDAVAAFLLHADTTPPLTMSVEGEWGTGKSSFMRQLKGELEKAPSMQTGAATTAPPVDEGSQRRITVQPLTFWFNAWRHDKQDAMWATFALSITKQMRDSRSVADRIWGDVKLAASRIETAAAWIHTVSVALFWLIFGGGALAVITFLFTAGSDKRTEVLKQFSATGKSASGFFQDAVLPIFTQITAAHYWLAIIVLLVCYAIWFRKGFGKRLEWKLAEYLDKPDYKNRAAFIEGFHSDFKKVIKAYAAKRRIFVFVDDLDRCDVPRAAELMQAINLMIGDDDHLIFILGMDREKIAAGITLKCKDLLPYLEMGPSGAPIARHAAAFGYSYLEKFIQITFRVPRPSESGIEEFLQSLARNPTDARGDETQKQAEQAIRRERRKKVEVRSRADSDEVKQLVMLVASALDWNPRRIKQFMNDFRLQAYIASDLGLLDLVETDEEVAASAKITLEQLGKFVAMTLTWPDLVMDLIGFPGLLTAIYKIEPDGSQAIGEDLREPQRNLVKRWSQQSALIDLLLANCGLDFDSKYSLANTDLRVLLNIAPRVNRNQDQAAGNQPDPTRERDVGDATTNPTRPILRPRPGSAGNVSARPSAEPKEYYGGDRDSSREREEAELLAEYESKMKRADLSEAPRPQTRK